jgi:hypothetical protein
MRVLSRLDVLKAFHQDVVQFWILQGSVMMRSSDSLMIVL